MTAIAERPTPVLAAPERLLTAEEFYDLYAGSDERVELVNGRVTAMSPVNVEHGDYDTELIYHLKGFVRSHRLGRVVAEVGFVLREDPDFTRAPDIAFVSAETQRRCPRPRRGYWRTAPDLAVEILSPDDTAEEVETKVHEYLNAGTRLVWVFYPRSRSVRVFRPDGSAQRLAGNDILDGEDVLPGFRLRLSVVWEELEQLDEAPERESFPGTIGEHAE
jgi:Uma2 family endonuclease